MLLSVPKAGKLFSALGSGSRLRIFSLIIEESEYFDEDENPPLSRNTVGGIAKLTGLAQATVSHHLDKLSKAGLLSTRQIGHHKFLFPVLTELQYLKEATEKLNNRAEVTVLAQSPVKTSRQIELAEIKNMMEFISLHENLVINGPVALDTHSGALRYRVHKESSRINRPLFITWLPETGEVFLGVKQQDALALEDERVFIEEVIVKFVNRKQEN